MQGCSCPSLLDASLDKLSTESVRGALQAYTADDSHYSRTRTVPLSEVLITSKMTNDKDKISHTFFAGGKGCVQRAQIQELRHLYTLDILCKDSNVSYMANQIERAIATSFPLFFDIDLLVVQQVDDAAALHRAYCVRVTQVVKRFFPSLELDCDTMLCIVCDRPPIVTSESSVKYGYHLHFPHIRVSVEQALFIREAVVASFREYYRERNVEAGENSWCDVFDVSVFKGSRGLRSIGSFKLKRAAPCNGTKEMHGRTFMQLDGAGRPITYWPTMALRGGVTDETWQRQIDRVFPTRADGTHREPATMLHRADMRRRIDDSDLHEYLRDAMLLVAMTAVRAYGTLTPGFEVYVGAPRPGTFLIDKAGAAGSAATMRKLAAKGKRPPGSARDRLLDHGPIHVAVQDYLRRLTDGDGQPIWPLIQVSQLYCRINPKRQQQQLLITVEGEGRNYCLNLTDGKKRGADHSSNRIYFWMANVPPFISQRCHSAKPPRAGHTWAACKCANFRSCEHGLVHGCRPPRDVLQLLNDMVHFDTAQPATKRIKHEIRNDVQKLLQI